ncbi:restriction endonuclease [Enterobacter wuhouensis]
MANLTLSDLLTPPTSANPVWFRSRGRNFERVLNQFLLNEKMDPHTSMRPKGEEIDGSFVLDDRYFLLEAKWHKDPIPASDLYAFKGKVDGKLIGTIGVFFSMSDYSTEAVDALLKGKELNIILFGHNDLLSIENRKITMREALKIKLRFAATYGQPFYSIESYLSNIVTSTNLEKDLNSKRVWSIIVEGEEDVGTIKELLSRFEINNDFTIFPAGGQLSVPSLSAHLLNTGNTNVAAIVTPIKNPKVQSKQIAELKSLEVEIISLPAPLEAWLDNYVTTEYHNATFMLSSREGKMARRYARNANVEQLLSDNPSFNSLIIKLKGNQI